MSQVIKLAPLGIGLVVFAVIVGFMLQRQMALGVWLFAAFLFGHGLVHIMFAAPPPVAAGAPGDEFAFGPDRSWLVTSRLLDVGVVKALVVALVVATVLGYALTALATTGLVIPTGWWATLLVVSTVFSAVLMLVGLSPALTLGIAIDVALLVVVFGSVWSPVVAA